MELVTISMPLRVVEENKTRTKPLFKTIEVNLKRRTVIVDDVLSYKNKPIPSWIELSIIDVVIELAHLSKITKNCT